MAEINLFKGLENTFQLFPDEFLADAKVYSKPSPLANGLPHGIFIRVIQE